MHQTVKDALFEWHEEHGPFGRVVDLGAFDINGSVKEVISSALGLDIYQGPGVDRCIEPGVIPEDLVGWADAVVSVSTFQFSDPGVFRQEVLGLLRMGGLFFMSMCDVSCVTVHRTSPVTRDSLRWSPEQVVGFMHPLVLTFRLLGNERHKDLVFGGRLTK